MIVLGTSVGMGWLVDAAPVFATVCDDNDRIFDVQQESMVDAMRGRRPEEWR